jgi:hypothetical protein
MLIKLFLLRWLPGIFEEVVNPSRINLTKNPLEALFIDKLTLFQSIFKLESHELSLNQEVDMTCVCF